MATIPTRVTKAVGDKVSANWANDNVKLPIDFTYDPPRCQVAAAVGQVFTDTVQTVVNYGTTVWDTDNMHDPVTNNSRVVLQTAGLYMIATYGDLPTATYTQFDVQLRVNGTTSIRTMNFVNPDAGVYRWQLYREFNAGDYVETLLTQTSGANRTGGTGNNVMGMTALWICELS